MLLLENLTDFSGLFRLSRLPIGAFLRVLPSSLSLSLFASLYVIDSVDAVKLGGGVIVRRLILPAGLLVDCWRDRLLIGLECDIPAST